MGSFVRARKRKFDKARRRGDEKGVKDAMKVRHSMARTYAEQYLVDRKCWRNAVSNLTDIFMLTVHERYGFGRGRILRLRDKMRSELRAIISGNVTVKEIDDFLKKEVRLDSGLSRKYTDISRYEAIEDDAVRAVSAAFLMAMLDEFGHKGKSLANACHYAFMINDKLVKNELTYPQIREKLQKVMERGQKKHVSDVPG